MRLAGAVAETVLENHPKIRDRAREILTETIKSGPGTEWANDAALWADCVKGICASLKFWRVPLAKPVFS